MYKAFGKRAFDLALASLGLIVLSPVLAATAVLVALKLGRPIFFRQVRGGYECKPFQVVKFRSMTDPFNADGTSRSEAERLTPFGKALRALSLDELPELWNVIKGEMSLVGPRPLMYDYMQLYSPHQRRRHEVRPGITGWAQVNGRNAVTWEERFDLDVWYVEHQSFALDLAILARTFGKVFRREGVSADGEATMSRFEGS